LIFRKKSYGSWIELIPFEPLSHPHDSSPYPTTTGPPAKEIGEVPKPLQSASQRAKMGAVLNKS